MAASQTHTIKEVFVLELSPEDVEALMRAMASVQPKPPAQAQLEVIDLVSAGRAQVERGPFAMPAVAA